MYDKRILSEKVADSIKEMIQKKDLNPGDKLPNEIQLSEELNVSRSTIREAIKLLATRNVLHVKRGIGTFVSKEPGLMNDPLGVAYMESDHIIGDLFEVRLMIEPAIAKLTAERATKTHIEALEKAFIQLKNDIINGRDHSKSDIDFHNIIAKSSGNPIINRIVPIINEGILEGYETTKNNPESNKIVLQHHENIMAAIRSKDGQKAYDFMKEHIEYGMESAKK